MPREHQKRLLRTAVQISLVATMLSLAVGVTHAQSENRPVTNWRHQPHFGVDVLVHGRPLHRYNVRNRTYVEAKAGADYEVSVTNPLPYRVAVALSVDGLNSIDARRTSAWDASKWVIEPFGTIRVRGWQMSSSRARRFYFTTEHDSYAAKLGKAQNLGVITAVFYRELTRKPLPITPRASSSDDDSQRKPRDKGSENRESLGGARRAERDLSEHAATGIGRSVGNDVQWIQLDLDSRAAAEITIRYEYYPALVRLGVISARKYQDPLERREESTGFEGRSFSPEP